MKTKLYRERFGTTYDVTKCTKINTVRCLNSKSQSKKNDQSDDLMEKKPIHRHLSTVQMILRKGEQTHRHHSTKINNKYYMYSDYRSQRT